jgi:hypothetical protein
MRVTPTRRSPIVPLKSHQSAAAPADLPLVPRPVAVDDAASRCLIVSGVATRTPKPISSWSPKVKSPASEENVDSAISSVPAGRARIV